ncbi:MAG: hypothetical protein IJR93_04850 [Treponema sp.]|nr:hypothetical protein [Treponema sp.]MBQ7166254.1 hypothetical protein [Treponema sp.]
MEDEAGSGMSLDFVPVPATYSSCTSQDGFMGSVKTKLECSKITEGVRFSKPVFFNDGKNMFLAAGCPAKKYHLEALRRWEIPYLWTDGTEVEDVPELPADKSPEPIVTRPEVPKVSEKIVSTQAAPAVSEDVDVSSFDKPKEPGYVRPKAVSYAAPRKPKVDRSGEEEVNIEDFIENFDEL